MSSGNVNPHTRDTVPTRDEGGSPYQRRNLLVETSNPRRGRRSRRGRGRGSRRRTSSRARPASAPGRNHDQELTFPSASRWEQRHSEALHAEHALNCPIGEIVPLQYCSEELAECIRPFQAMSREDVNTCNYDRMETAFNEISSGNNRLWNATMRGGIYACMSVIENLIQRFAGYGSHDSDSNDEVDGHDESFPQSLAEELCSTALSKIAQFDFRHYPSWNFRAFKTSVDVSPNGTSCGVWTDGIIRYVLNRRHYIPYVWIEVKQLHQAPQTSEEPETAAYLSTLPQKTAEAIAMAKYGHREVFGIEFSHRFVAFWHVVVPDDYLELIKNPQEIPPHVRFVMRRSRVFDLALPDDRFEFFRAFLALMLYLDEQARSNA